MGANRSSFGHKPNLNLKFANLGEYRLLYGLTSRNGEILLLGRFCLYNNEKGRHRKTLSLKIMSVA